MKIDLPTGHVPARVTWEGGVPFVELAPLTGFNPTLPFFCQNIWPDARNIRVELDRIRCGEDADPHARPSGFVFHMSRCGSTLVSQMFAALSQVLVLAEPDALKDVLRAPDRVSDRCVALALRKVMSLYAKTLRNRGQHLIVKWNSWALVHLTLIELAFPFVPSCYVTRDPVEVMVSLIEKPTGWLRRRDRCSTREQILPAGEAEQVQPCEIAFCARSLARFCESAVNCPSDLTAFDFAELPDAVWEALAPFFGIFVSENDREAMRSAARLYSKDPSRTRPFIRDSERKQQQASAAVRSQATKLVEPALVMVRTRLPRPAPRNRLERANRSHQRALELYYRGQYLTALQLALVEQDETVGPPASCEFLRSLTLIAKLLSRLCRNAEALDTYRQLLIRVECEGAAPDAVAGLNNAIGENQQALGLYEEAEKSFREVLRIRMAIYGPVHPNFAIALNALATLQHRQGNALFAEQLYRQACRLQVEALGSRHSHCATALNNLASFLVDRERLDEALQLYENAIDIRRQALGETNPIYASSISNLAELLKRKGDLETSERLHRQALEIRMICLGADHFHVGRSWMLLGNLLRIRGKLTESHRALCTALDILLVSVGEDFPLTRDLLFYHSHNDSRIGEMKSETG